MTEMRYSQPGLRRALGGLPMTQVHDMIRTASRNPGVMIVTPAPDGNGKVGITLVEGELVVTREAS